MIRLRKPENIFELTDWRIIDTVNRDIGWVIEHRVAGFKFAFVYLKRSIGQKEREALTHQLEGFDVIYHVEKEL